jgi:hypothetical protein
VNDLKALLRAELDKSSEYLALRFGAQQSWQPGDDFVQALAPAGEAVRSVWLERDPEVVDEMLHCWARFVAERYEWFVISTLPTAG